MIINSYKSWFSLINLVADYFIDVSSSYADPGITNR